MNQLRFLGTEYSKRVEGQVFRTSDDRINVSARTVANGLRVSVGATTSNVSPDNAYERLYGFIMGGEGPEESGPSRDIPTVSWCPLSFVARELGISRQAVHRQALLGRFKTLHRLHDLAIAPSMSFGWMR